MEDKFYNDEFEQFLQQQANNHRMYPTDGVWLGINKKLHGHKKWPALTISAFTILFATIATSLYFSPKPNIFELPQQSKAAIDLNDDNNASTPLTNLIGIHKRVKGSNLVSQERIVSNNNDKNTLSTPVDDAVLQTGLEDLPGTNDQEVSLAKPKLTALMGTQTAQQSEAEKTPELNTIYRTTDGLTLTAIKGDTQTDEPTSNSVSTEQDKTPVKIIPEKDPSDKNITDKFLQEHDSEIALYTTNKLISRRNKFSYTVYIAPSASYRKLRENEDLNRKSTNINGPVAANYVTDVNKLVRHRPGTGVEAGLSLTYHLTSTLGVKTGLQFNVRQYNIEAFKTSTELAAIALLSNTGIDTINTYAVYRNANGNRSAELINRYYQISVPIGVEWEVLGSKKVKFNVAANIQPTYNLNRNSYILSTNFKNYTANSGMLRNWNINSSIEAFMSVKVGEYRWQLGPQFRYQNLSTFIAEYPIRENLMDYGFKIGVSKVIK